MTTKLKQDRRITFDRSGVSRSSTFASWVPYHLETSEDFWMTTTSTPPSLRPDTVWTLSRSGSKILEHFEANTSWCQGPVVVGSFITSSDGLGPAWSSFGGSTETELKAFGTKAIGLVAPNKSSVDLPVAVGELYRDGIPRLPAETIFWQDQVKHARDAGSEYLNVEFGWKPLVSDIYKTFRTLKSATSIVKNFRDGGNRPQRRRYDDPSDQFESRLRKGNVTFLPSVPSLIGPGTLHESREISTWFVGTFKYHIPIGDDTLSRIQRYEAYANKLFGTRLDPETLWNLTPWSWAADWFGNIGDVLRNVSNLGQDGTALTRGCVMQQRKLRQVTSGSIVSTKASGRSVREFNYESKIRRIASPYGFNIDWPEFTDQQIAVATALGMTRGGGRVAF